MKKITAILLVLVIAGFGLFAAVDNTKANATINVESIVADFSAFGVSSLAIEADAFKTIASFQGAVSSSVDTTIAMLALDDFVLVGHLSGINNTAADVVLKIAVDPLTDGTNTVGLTLSTEEQTIAASADSAFGTLKNTPIKVKETTGGAAALAPAGTYTTTITISLITG